MMNKSKTIDVAMVFRKFYCHKCGEKLVKHPRTYIVEPGDPDYRKHSRRGHSHMIGPVEVTEYDFKCCTCDTIIHPEEQYVTEKIQKTLGKHILTNEEIAQYQEQAKQAIDKKRKTTDIIVKIVFGILAVVAFCLGLKYGFSLNFYL